MSVKREWWMPLQDGDESYPELNWLCDHMGDGQEVLDRLWEELCKHRPELPVTGFKCEYDD